MPSTRVAVCPEDGLERHRERVSEFRYGLPNNERNRLVLYFSKNCVDWIFAGVISIGQKEQHARNYPSMIIDGNNLIIVSRAGNDQAKDCQYNNAIMMHQINNFRELVY